MGNLRPGPEEKVEGVESCELKARMFRQASLICGDPSRLECRCRREQACRWRCAQWQSSLPRKHTLVLFPMVHKEQMPVPASEQLDASDAPILCVEVGMSFAIIILLWLTWSKVCLWPPTGYMEVWGFDGEFGRWEVPNKLTPQTEVCGDGRQSSRDDRAIECTD